MRLAVATGGQRLGVCMLMFQQVYDVTLEFTAGRHLDRQSILYFIYLSFRHCSVQCLYSLQSVWLKRIGQVSFVLQCVVLRVLVNVRCIMVFGWHALVKEVSDCLERYCYWGSTRCSKFVHRLTSFRNLGINRYASFCFAVRPNKH
jgi:hypothetical protein